VILPLLVLVWASLLPLLMLPSARAFSTVSLVHFRKIDWSLTLGALSNSLLLSVLTATLVTLFSFAVSWVVLRSRARFKPVYDFLAFAPHVVPSTLFLRRRPRDRPSSSSAISCRSTARSGSCCRCWSSCG